MKTLITLTAISIALVFGDPSFADQEVFGVALEENDEAALTVTAIRGSYIEKDRTSFYTNPRAVKSGEPQGDVLNSSVKLLPDRDALYNLRGLKFFDNPGVSAEYEIRSANVTGYRQKNITVGDILRLIPAVSTENEDTVGILLPPFGYFAKKF